MKRPTLSNDNSASMYPGRSYITPSSKTPPNPYQKPLSINFNSPKSEAQKGFAFPQKATGQSLRASSKTDKVDPNLGRKNSKNASEIYNQPPTATGVSRSSKVRGSSTKASSTEKNKTEQSELGRPFAGNKYSDTLNLRDSLLKQSRPKNLEVNTDIQTFKTTGGMKAYTTKNKDGQERLQVSTMGPNSSHEYSAKYMMNHSAVNNISKYDYVRTEASEDKQSLTPTLKQKNALGRILANTSEKAHSAMLKKTSQLEEEIIMSNSPQGTLKVNNFFSNPKKKDDSISSKKDHSLNISKKEHNNTASDKEELMRTLEYNMKMANRSQVEYKPSYKGIAMDDSEIRDNRNLSLNTPAKESKASAPQKASLSSFITKVDKGTAIPMRPKNNEDRSAGLPPSKPYLTLEEKANMKATRSSSDMTASAKTTTNAENKNFAYGKNKPGQQAFGSPQEVEKAKMKSSGVYSRESRESREEGRADSPSRDSMTYYVTSMEKHHRSWNDTDYFCQIYKEHLIQSFQALTFCKYLRPVDPKVLAQKKVFLPKKASHKEKKTVIFDLDETLIHCNESTDIPSDVILPIRFPHGEIIEAGINIRPYAVEILKEISQHFEVIVFTASHSCYANVVLDYLDPQQQYVHHRLFRENCVVTDEGVYIKDLRILGNRNLQDMVLVDNAAYSFGYQVENGIPIIPYYDNKQDQELKHLIPYLKSLAAAKDCRDVNRQTFKMHAYTMYDTLDKVLNKVILQN